MVKARTITQVDEYSNEMPNKTIKKKSAVVGYNNTEVCPHCENEINF